MQVLTDVKTVWAVGALAIASVTGTWDKLHDAFQTDSEAAILANKTQIGYSVIRLEEYNGRPQEERGQSWQNGVKAHENRITNLCRELHDLGGSDYVCENR